MGSIDLAHQFRIVFRWKDDLAEYHTAAFPLVDRDAMVAKYSGLEDPILVRIETRYLTDWTEEQA